MAAVLTLLIVAALTGADQWIKYAVTRDLAPNGVRMLIPGVLQAHYAENDGAMMGLPGKRSVMIVAAVLVLAVLLYIVFSKKLKPGFLYGCLTIVIAGGLGNIIDRLRFGYVVDYIEVLFVDFYIFNFADCLITVGAFAILFYQIADLIRSGRRQKEPADG
ncbi:MAG: signal peptidase II [Clostridia bacterium]|nr:signal peptidase II [Clostridia bacterium]